MGHTSGKHLIAESLNLTNIQHQMIEANKGWQVEEIKEMYKGCLPFSYMTKPCNHRGSNVTDSKLPECTYEFNSCKGEEDGLGSGRRKRSGGESGGCLSEANGWEYRGSVSETASGKYEMQSEKISFLSCIIHDISFNENLVQLSIQFSMSGLIRN